MLRYDDSILLFSEVLDQLQNELKMYVAKPDAKPGFVQKQNKLIGNLITVYNGIQIQDAELWQQLVLMMNEMRKADPHQMGFTIHLREKPTGGMGQIDLNLYTVQ